MRIGFRADMNSSIATGHLMRCLSIADEAKRSGEETLFIVSDHEADELLRSRGHEHIVLNNSWNDKESDLPLLKKLIKEKSIDYLIIDSYQITERYLSELTKAVRTMYIDDIHSGDHDVTNILCYALYWEKFYRADSKGLLAGPEYIPLRKEYVDVKDKKINDKAEELLFLSGGSDSCNSLNRLIDSIDVSSYKKISVICGRYYKDYPELMMKAEKYRNISLYKSVNNIWEHMKSADIAVSAGGTTLYELCALGTPVISYSFVDNQLDNVKSFQEKGLIPYLGDARYDDIGAGLKKTLVSYGQKEKRKEISFKLQRTVDGRGAERIIKIIKEESDRI